MDKEMALRIWDKKPELKESFDNILHILNDLFPDKSGEHVEFVEDMMENVNMRVGSYYPACLVGKRLQIFDPNSNVGTKNPRDICTVQNITTERNDVYRGSYLLECYVQAMDTFNYTAMFNWDKCVEHITELD